MSPHKTIVDIEADSDEERVTRKYSTDIRDMIVSYLMAESKIISLKKTKTDERYWLQKTPT